MGKGCILIFGGERLVTEACFTADERKKLVTPHLNKERTVLMLEFLGVDGRTKDILSYNKETTKYRVAFKGRLGRHPDSSV